jgi:hypothetical protein
MKKKLVLPVLFAVLLILVGSNVPRLFPPRLEATRAYALTVMFYGNVTDGDPVYPGTVTVHGPMWTKQFNTNLYGDYMVSVDPAEVYTGYYCLEARNQGNTKRASTTVYYEGTTIQINFTIKSDGPNCPDQK